MSKRFIFSIILCLSFLASPADALIKRSKKKECTVCHILWMEDLQTDGENLLSPFQENIVISGSIGLSSSQGICTSCHDGYVVDSRTRIMPGNKHHQLKKVPDWLDLPAAFRLDINNEFYCGTCHGFHDVKASGEIGTVPFMRLENDRSEMCMACHKDKKENPGVSNHPILMKSDLLQREKIEKLGGKLGPDGEMICQSCHLPHGNPPLLKPLSGSQVCLVCHDDKKTVFRSAHNLSITFPQGTNTTGTSVDETGPCSSCHLPHNGNGKWMWAQEPGTGNPATRACMSCHGRKLGIRVTGRYSHPVDVQLTTETGLPLYGDDGSKALDGKVQCPSCHNVHQWNPDDPDGYIDRMEGGTGDSFLRKTNESSGLCVTCHDRKQSLIGTDHDLRVTAPDLLNGLGLKPSASGPCEVCHIPHRAANKQLWAGARLVEGNPASAMCLACHEKETELINKPVGEHSHPIDVVPQPAEGSTIDLPLFAKPGEKDAALKVQCATCHDPHQWQPGSLAGGAHKNIEGDGANSFLRVANQGNSALCVQCHDNKKPVLASDHNLQATAPDEKNLMDADPVTSGPCGACHVPHNAVDRKLWAKQLTGEDDVTSQLCFSCHNAEGAARKKPIGDHSHPVNIGLEKQIDIDLPLYRREGEIWAEGKVVCTTCHDPHIWKPGADSADSPVSTMTNQEGDNGDSFLRKVNKPNSTLCMTCHLEEALVLGTPHDLVANAPRENNILGQAAGEAGQCSVCHLVHNSPNDLKLWARPYGPLKKNENRMAILCTSCHAQGKIGANKIQELATHPLGTLTSYEDGFLGVVYDDSPYVRDNRIIVNRKNPTQKYTPILITNVIGANSGNSFTPIFNDAGDKVRTGTISCPSCHNVHKWNMKDTPGEEKTDRSGKQGAKFLRTESANLVCVDCHGLDGIYRYLYFHSEQRKPKHQ